MIILDVVHDDVLQVIHACGHTQERRKTPNQDTIQLGVLEEAAVRRIVHHEHESLKESNSKDQDMNSS
jgi:hypothetical protein